MHNQVVFLHNHIEAQRHSFDQSHLNFEKRVNLGGYYTNPFLVKQVWQMISPYLTPNTIVLDSSCGYGNFFINSDVSKANRIIGNDIDAVAVNHALQHIPHLEVYNKNSLCSTGRAQFNISEDDSLIIIGNPPYNDTTSIVRSNTKKQLFDIDPHLQSRDLGISFLKSYAALKADVVCILHPLSYIIKEANFNALGGFSKHYKLIDNLIVGSHFFTDSSKGMQFPIVIGLYQRDGKGMSFKDVRRIVFKTIEGFDFKIDDWHYIREYINKYPTRYHTPKPYDIYFWTLRDLNALKRNRTFINDYCSNAIVVPKDKLDYFVYVDVVKDFSSCFPYYLGNFDVIINNDIYDEYKKYFIAYSINKNSFLMKNYKEYSGIKFQDCKKYIVDYFMNLLGAHYVHVN